jgi:hypothetical protein
VIVTLLLLSELVLIAGIIALWILSALHAGFVNVGIRSSNSSDFSVQGALDRGQPLLWTALPTLIFTLYRLFREAVVSALVVETPFIELHKSSNTHHTKVRKSIYVDYRTSFNIVAWYKALRNRHSFLGLCMLFSFVVSLALVPLAGALFTEGGELLASNAAVDVLSIFDPSVDITFLDYGHLLDTVSTSWIDAAPYPAGTDGTFPLPRIKPTQDPQNYTISSTAQTSQLSLDCRFVDDATIVTEAKTENRFQTNFSAIDRDCAISEHILATSVNIPNKNYFKAISELDCPVWAGRTRVVFFYVELSSSGEFQNSTLISCIPSYWNVNGTVSVIGITGSTGRRIETPSFAERSRVIEELPEPKRRQFEQGITGVITVNIGSVVNTPSRLAELVVRYIDSRNLELTAEDLVEALSTIYAATYTMLCVDHFYPTLVQPVHQDGILQISKNRLHVVQPVAIAMLAILTLLIIETIYLIIYLRRHPSILAEEPVGLIGAAKLLHESNIPCLIAKLHDDPAFNGRLRGENIQDSTTRKMSEISHMDDQLLDLDCWVEQGTAFGRWKIVVESKAGGDECAKLLHGHTIPKRRKGPASQPHIQHPAPDFGNPAPVSVHQGRGNQRM